MPSIEGGSMRARVSLSVMAACAAIIAAPLQGQRAAHLNPMIALHAQKKPLFGLYAPANRGGGRRGGGDASAPAPAPPPQKTPADLVKDALAYEKADFL